MNQKSGATDKKSGEIVIKGGNIWAAGRDIVLGKDSSAKAVGAAGKSIRADGEYKVAYYAGEKVYIDGKVSKSLNIEAEEVEFGPNAEVTGVIKVEAKDTENFELSYIDIDMKKIPEGYYFVIGDNRNNSIDSRIIGLVKKEDIKGTVTQSLIPFKKVK